jgi:hypothetical protein
MFQNLVANLCYLSRHSWLVYNLVGAALEKSASCLTRRASPSMLVRQCIFHRCSRENLIGIQASSRGWAIGILCLGNN